MTKTLTNEEETLSGSFDDALKLRDEGKTEEAKLVLLALVPKLEAVSSQKLLAHTHVQLGLLQKRSNDAVAAEHHYRRATEIAPKFELASGGLFHALRNLNRNLDSMIEMVRFLRLKDSSAYRELFEDGFGADLPEDEARLADEAQSLLAEYAKSKS